MFAFSCGFNNLRALAPWSIVGLLDKSSMTLLHDGTHWYLIRVCGAAELFFPHYRYLSPNNQVYIYLSMDVLLYPAIPNRYTTWLWKGEIFSKWVFSPRYRCLKLLNHRNTQHKARLDWPKKFIITRVMKFVSSLCARVKSAFK